MTTDEEMTELDSFIKQAGDFLFDDTERQESIIQTSDDKNHNLEFEDEFFLSNPDNQFGKRYQIIPLEHDKERNCIHDSVFWMIAIVLLFFIVLIGYILNLYNPPKPFETNHKCDTIGLGIDLKSTAKTDTTSYKGNVFIKAPLDYCEYLLKEKKSENRICECVGKTIVLIVLVAAIVLILHVYVGYRTKKNERYASIDNAKIEYQKRINMELFQLDTAKYHLYKQFKEREISLYDKERLVKLDEEQKHNEHVRKCELKRHELKERCLDKVIDLEIKQLEVLGKDKYEKFEKTEKSGTTEKKEITEKKYYSCQPTTSTSV